MKAIALLLTLALAGCASVDRVFRSRVESLEPRVGVESDGKATRAVVGAKFTFREPK